ncbi:thioredoxin domain-containing protein, partial [Pseudomonas sp. BGM005]|nr:thioredoxin domain-containing protein [Pseudomonas sp. BG5]
AGLVDAPRQLVVVTDAPAGALASAARAAEADVVAIVAPAQARAFAEAGFELFEGKGDAGELAFDCRSFVCRRPVSDPSQLSRTR